jgi:DNA modification methylase
MSAKKGEKNTPTELPLNHILLGDCIEVLRSLPAESVDVVFADPPYNLQLNKTLERPNRTVVDGVNHQWDRFESFQTYDAFTREWVNACRRVLKPDGMLWVIGSYHNIFRVGTILQDLGFWILNDIIWIKTNPMPNFHGVRFTNAHETLIWAQKEHHTRYVFNHHAMKALNDDLQMRSDWHLPICRGKKRLKFNGSKAHPTQKPEALLYRVIEACTNPGDIILDPFFGTGTTGAVAKKLRRNWIGIEKDPDYVQVAKQRIDAIPENGKLDDAIFIINNPRRKPRIAFGSLLENNLLQPGDTLYFFNNEDITAQIMADGSLLWQNQRGSIHAIAKIIKPGPTNGWKSWLYWDEKSQSKKSIDHLREKIRSKLSS